MSHIKIENLSMIFGKKKNQVEALRLIDEGIDIAEVMKQTDTTVALKNVSFEIKDTELFVIVGLSGSGKSTLIRCLNRLNEPTRGEIYVGDENILAYDKEKLLNFRRNRISMVFQHFGLLSHRSILRNVEYGLEVQGVDKDTRKDKAMTAIKVVGLEGNETKFPHELSGGMKQRVGIARALITEPDILLMDEPYSALDPLIRREMQNELLNLEDYINRTIVFITHDMNEAFKMGDRIALMKDGEVVQIGTPQEFFSNPKNDYVRDFISDVDKTQIIKVRSVMNKTTVVAKDTSLRSDVLETMDLYKKNHLFIVDENNLYQGIVHRNDVARSRSTEIKDLIQPLEAVYRNTYIKSLWERFDVVETDLPVINKDGYYKGSISKNDMIKALA
ncbi:Glycine betaine/L-proline ABC transporter, ATPase subunit [Paracholeplasma brassicae]|uniref:Glycine betaine/L-proline ABC transporter, ATPase subunit n=1 Tax=Acholeplasma brassicae TaxID=61635 RepID=U4KPU2_9MOLU|nr:betaine/proline/choline family ABC transporter ATP-binding protein [Paracholeplasma brassicae]CCV66497.1 Glycine betaine/L-proline ABC transporter, ATPase subunit [Paracholeplasma brassicae]